MKEDPDIRQGDWVRFYQNGIMVIGVVQYIIKDITSYRQVCTDIGTVSLDNVLEYRRQGFRT